MASSGSFTNGQLAFLEGLLSPGPEAVASLADDEGGHGSAGCNDDGEDASPCDLPPTLGTNQDNILSGAGGSQHFHGLNGNDTLSGGGGRDCLDGGNGNDLLDGGAGRDFLFGGNGDDELRGGQGRDDLFGGRGNDLLIGDCGPDLIDGGLGNDVLFGGNAPDTITGGQGNDIFVLALSGGDDGDHGGGEHDADSIALVAPSAHDGDDGHEECTEGIDVVTDFRQGSDQLALAGGLRFDQLAFKYDEACQGTLLFVISAHEHDDAALASSATTGDDHGSRPLAFLAGFSGTLSEQDFLAYNDLGSLAVVA